MFVSSFAKIVHWTASVSTDQLALYCKWDCSWYQDLSRQGYDKEPHLHAKGDAANWIFYPMFPLTAKVVAAISGLPSAAATPLASRIAFFFCIWLFLVMVRNDLHQLEDYFLAGSLVALNPYLIYAYVGYSEPLYFTMACVAFIFLQRQRWVASGLAGAVLSATRIVGLLFSISYAIVALRDLGWRRIARDRDLNVVIGVLLCPFGLVLFSLYLYHLSGDALAFSHLRVSWGQNATNPFRVLYESFLQHGWSRVWTVMAIGTLLLSTWLLKIRPEYGVFLGLSVLMGAASGLLIGMPRFIWWQPMFLYGLLVLFQRLRFLWPIYLAFSGGMAAIMIVNWFVGSSNFVT